MSVIDTATHTVIDLDPATAGIQNLTVGAAPRKVAFSPDGALDYVTNSGSGMVSVITLAPGAPPLTA